MKEEAEELLKTETEQLDRLNTIVRKAIKEEKLILKNLKNPPKDYLTRGQRLSDKIARFGGSWSFITIFVAIIVAWIFANTFSKDSYDPYPFILLNLVLSCVAALQAPIIMMSQNRQEEKDRKRAENDYLINLKAELEIRALNQKIDLLLQEQIKILFDSQAKQLEILEKLQDKIENKK